MALKNTDFDRRNTVLILMVLVLCGFVAWPTISQAQRNDPPAASAQIGMNSPLPVYVTNTPTLPEGFVPGSTWIFTTWTTPSVLTWSATVQRTSGAWAYLEIQVENGTKSRWYYVPAMTGSWERQ